MTAENAGAAEATPPDNVTETKTEVAAAPNSGAVSFSDYVKTLPDDLPQHATKKGWKDYGDAIKAPAPAESLIGTNVDLPKPGHHDALKAHLIKNWTHSPRTYTPEPGGRGVNYRSGPSPPDPRGLS